ncbi:MAG: glycogen/starch/alpha-glucan phosphorylase, partial [Thermodesulfovibrionales bacterium]|nr:glycogen/starch/alpha-glucan phosphorylase [Thermodesulfovibrionales bacterium]
MDSMNAILSEFVKEQKIAYFSMEIGVMNEAKTYSGGLGVLAGDTIRSAADLKLPMVAVTLITKKGYFTQELEDDGTQVEKPAEWEPSDYMTLMPARTHVNLDGRDVAVQAWLYIQ